MHIERTLGEDDCFDLEKESPGGGEVLLARRLPGLGQPTTGEEDRVAGSGCDLGGPAASLARFLDSLPTVQPVGEGKQRVHFAGWFALGGKGRSGLPEDVFSTGISAICVNHAQI